MQVGVEDTYVRVLPRELERIEVVEEEGGQRFFRLNLGDLTLSLRRVRVAGAIESVESGSEAVELIVSGGGSSVRVVSWGRGVELLKLRQGDYVEALGSLKVFRDQVYVSLFIVRRIEKEGFEKFVRRMERDRKLITDLRSRFA